VISNYRAIKPLIITGSPKELGDCN